MYNSAPSQSIYCRWKRDLDEIVDYLEDKMNNHLSKKLQKKPLTRPKSFNLTKPKPRQIPLPERLPTLPKRKSIPKTTFKLVDFGFLTFSIHGFIAF